jgi:hypothetical protein
VARPLDLFDAGVRSDVQGECWLTPVGPHAIAEEICCRPILATQPSAIFGPAQTVTLAAAPVFQ